MGDLKIGIALCVAFAGCLQTSVAGTSGDSGTAVPTGAATGSSMGAAGGSSAGSSRGGSSSGTTTGSTSDPCVGVVCTATGAACYNGVCKCGGASGVECDAPGYSCSPIDNSCGPTASCEITPCAEPGTICNPSDPVGRQCHCGTVAGPICAACQLYFADGGQALTPGEDAGGAEVIGKCGTHDPCEGVTCPPNETCDHNNFDLQTLMGTCECGGDPNENIPGVVCASNQTCVAASDGGECQ